jgi:hypothetical protein
MRGRNFVDNSSLLGSSLSGNTTVATPNLVMSKDSKIFES